MENQAKTQEERDELEKLEKKEIAARFRWLKMNHRENEIIGLKMMFVYN